jgi:large subunit ribosomal protein L14
MIQMQTKLKVSDNSGAKTVKCIKVLGGFRRKIAKAGNIIVVSIQKLRNKYKETSKVKKREVYKAIILKTKKEVKKKTGETLKFDENSITLINKQNGPLATRISSHLPKNLKKKKFQKFLGLSYGTI